ncbi:MAG: AAA family ATPase [Chromatiales bacterium]|nr:AAA family ATPase [Chromatiales bacterium]
MRFLSLHLRAFGRFTDARLDLSGGDAGLHVVLGRNEAGKSTMLRALRGLLFGIPERTTDAFLHPQPALRVGARLQTASGEVLECYRRKGRRDTLLDADDRPIPDSALGALLGGVDEALFVRLFGVDHEALVAGGKELLVERGREAEALFGAGVGSGGVRAVVTGLEDEARALFAPRGRNPEINALLSDLQDIDRRERAAVLTAARWEEVRRAAERAAAEVEAAEEALTAAVDHQARLARVRRTLPGLVRRREELAALARLGDLPDLDETFPARHRDARDRLRRAEESIRRIEALDGRLAAEAEALADAGDLVGAADVIEALRERAAAARDAAGERGRAAAAATARREEAARLLAAAWPELPVDTATGRRELLARRRRIDTLAAEDARISERARQVEADRVEIEARLAAARRERDAMALPPAPDALRRAVEAARRLGDVDGDVAGLERELDLARDALARDAGALGLAVAQVEALLIARLPPAAAVEHAVRIRREHQLGCARAEEALAMARGELLSARERLDALTLLGEVPDEEALAASRARRDLGWSLLRRRWVDGDDVSDAAADYDHAPLEEAYERAVAGADLVADRLRREARQVHELATARARLGAAEARVDESSAALEAAEAARTEHDSTWSAMWAEIGQPPPPAEDAVGWLAGVDRLLELSRRVGAQVERLDARRSERARHVRRLADQVDAAVRADLEDVARLDDWLAAAERSLARDEGERSAHEALTRRIAELELQVDALRRRGGAVTAERVAWSEAWNAATIGLDLDPHATPAEAAERLEALAAALGHLDGALVEQRRVEALDRQAADLAAAVAATLPTLADDLVGASPDAAVQALGIRLDEDRERSALRRDIDARRRQAAEELAAARDASKAATRALAALCREARVSAADELEAVERRAAEARGLRESVAALGAQLRDAGDGLGLEALEAEAAAVDPDTLPGEIRRIDERIETELQPRHRELLAAKVHAERDFDAMAGEDAAAELAERRTRLVATLRDAVERYAVRRLAVALLREEVERYRAENRDPVIATTGRYFARLTDGAFRGIDTDYDADDAAVLVGVRADGAKLGVGGMSTGTRDQLYLALRLGTLAHHAERVEPLPLVVDDVLVQFDDERSRATLAVLAEFSAVTQVILFTHHHHVATLAREVDAGEGRVLVHQLD